MCCVGVWRVSGVGYGLRRDVDIALNFPLILAWCYRKNSN